jgi:hypothetical protein
VGNGDADADEYMRKLLPTKVGRCLFPATSALIGASEHLQKLGKNCAKLLEQTGRHLKQALGFFLVGGLPTSFAVETLNITGPETSYYQKQPVPAAMKSLDQRYAPNIEKQTFTEAEESVMEDFFFRTTSVMSGALRQTRNLEKTEHEWQEEMYAVWPQMLRKAVRMNPQLAQAKQPLKKKEQESGAPHGMAVLCVIVHEIMGPSSVHITWCVSSSTNYTFHTSGLTAFQASCRAARICLSPLARSLAVCGWVCETKRTK